MLIEIEPLNCPKFCVAQEAGHMVLMHIKLGRSRGNMKRGFGIEQRHTLRSKGAPTFRYFDRPADFLLPTKKVN